MKVMITLFEGRESRAVEYPVAPVFTAVLTVVVLVETTLFLAAYTGLSEIVLIITNVIMAKNILMHALYQNKRDILIYDEKADCNRHSRVSGYCRIGYWCVFSF